MCGAAGPTGLFIDVWHTGLAAVTLHRYHPLTHSGCVQTYLALRWHSHGSEVAAMAAEGRPRAARWTP